MLTSNGYIKYIILGFISISSLLILNSCKKDMFQGTNEPDIIHDGSLFVNSDPKSMKIYFDNNYLGADSPDTINWLAEGNHQVTLKHDLYPDTTFSVNLSSGQVKSYYINGFANPHFYNKIFVESEPVKTNIVFNDSIKGIVTPYLIQHLLPGNYKVKLELAEHRSDSIEVYVKKGETRKVKLYLEDTTKFVTYRTYNSGIISDNITAVTVDKNNLKWIGTIDNGIVTFDGKNWKKMENTGGYNVFNISKMEFDKFGRLWINCSSGLLMYDNLTWRDYNSEVGTNLINDFTFDNDGNILISTYHGLYYQHGNGWTVYNKSNTCMRSDSVNTSFISSNGSLWIGTNNLAVEINSDSCKVIVRSGGWTLDPIFAVNVYRIFEDDFGVIWYFHKTIDKDHKSTFVILDYPLWHVSSVPYVSPDFFNSAYIDKGIGVWFCTNYGVTLRRSASSFLNISKTNSDIPIRQCKQIIKDLTGNYWIACLGYGLVQIKKGTIE